MLNLKCYTVRFLVSSALIVLLTKINFLWLNIILSKRHF